MKDPGKAAQKWARNLAAAGDTIREGVQRRRVSPGTGAAAAKEAYKQGVANNVDKWARNVAAISLPDWQAAILGKGLGRIASGVADARGQGSNFLPPFI